MDQRDRTMAILGAVCVVLSAALGVAFAKGVVGDEDGAPGNLVADWSMTSTFTDSQAGLNSQVVDLTVPHHNLTRLSVRLTWTDDEFVSVIGRRADILTLRVEGPPALAAEPQQVQGTAGELQVIFDLAPIPTDDDPSYFEDYDFTDATGDWSVTVTVDPQGLRDTGNDWTLTLSYTYYVGRLIEAPEAT